MSKARQSSRRSSCPLNIALEMIGDRWSLLILRDLMICHARTFKDLMSCPERIASNILSDRLKKLIAHQLVVAKPDPADARKFTYGLTEKGADLAAPIAELVLWASRHEKTGNQPLVDALRKDKDRMIEQVKAQWARAHK